MKQLIITISISLILVSFIFGQGDQISEPKSNIHYWGIPLNMSWNDMQNRLDDLREWARSQPSKIVFIVIASDSSNSKKTQNLKNNIFKFLTKENSLDKSRVKILIIKHPSNEIRHWLVSEDEIKK